jgi:hypothetical protein
MQATPGLCSSTVMRNGSVAAFPRLRRTANCAEAARRNCAFTFRQLSCSLILGNPPVQEGGTCLLPYLFIGSSELESGRLTVCLNLKSELARKQYEYTHDSRQLSGPEASRGRAYEFAPDQVLRTSSCTSCTVHACHRQLSNLFRLSCTWE